MKRAGLLILFAICFMSIFCGCKSTSSSAGLRYADFLSDYSRLVRISDTSSRYINPNIDMRVYRKFIVDPVKVLFDYGTDSDVKTWDDIGTLRTYMRNVIVDAIPDYVEAVAPGPGVARVRAAMTNVKKASAFSMSSVSVEIEFIDSQTGEQIAALVETQRKGGALGEYYDWENAKKIMDEWGVRLRERYNAAIRK
jgi:hypothetical protein